MSNKNFGFGTQIRKSPYFDSTVKWGATGFSVYNHMYIPRDFGDPEQKVFKALNKLMIEWENSEPSKDFNELSHNFMMLWRPCSDSVKNRMSQ